MKATFKVISVLSACPNKNSDKVTPTVTVAGIASDGRCIEEATQVYSRIVSQGAYATSARNDCLRLQVLIADKPCIARNNYASRDETISYSSVQNICQTALASNNGGTNQPYPNQPYPTQPGYPQPIQNIAMKNLVCSIDMNSGTAAGTISNMPVQVFANGANLRLYANMQNSKSYLGGLINVNRTFSSEKLALLGLKFKAGSGSTGDTLTLSADLRNGKSATVTGYAGSEVRIEIAADSENDTSVVVSCTGQDSFNVGSAGSGANIKCSGTEVDGSKTTKINFINPVSDLITSGIFPSLSSDLALEGNGQSVLSATVRPVLAMESYKVVTSTVSPSSMSIKSPGYSLSTNCNLQ